MKHGQGRAYVLLYFAVVSGFAITFTYIINVAYAIYSGGWVRFNVNYYGEAWLELCLLAGCLATQVWAMNRCYKQALNRRTPVGYEVLEVIGC